MKRNKVVRPRTRPKTEDVIDVSRKAAATAIRDARVRAGLTQEKAAGLRGHATSTISRWESGGLPNTWDELHQYATALGQPIVLKFGKAKDDPRPKWAGAMEKRIVSEVASNRTVLLEALALGFAEQARRRLAEDNDDEGPDGNEDQPPGGVGPKPAPAP
jgi:transcriptional regulator with XRE-family HTH domain